MHLPSLVNLIPFPPRFFMKTLTSSCRPSRTSSTHLLPLALYHVIWRQPLSNLCWKSYHLTKIFWKTTVPFLTYHFCPTFSKRSCSTNISLISKKTTSAIPFSSLSSRTQHWDRFVTYCKRYSLHSRQWHHFCSSFVGSFCRFWHYWPPNSSLPPELFLAFSLLHSNGFSHTSQTDICPLQSITRLRHHHSSCTVCLRAQYWGPFFSSCILRLSPIS